MAAVKLSESIYYIPGGTNVGVIVCKGRIRSAKRKNLYLIDSGMDATDAERIYNELENLFPLEKGGFCVKAIINTHGHADHTGGNAYFVRRTRCKIWISKIESAGILNPRLHGTVFGGGHPPKHLQIPYFLPEASDPDKIISEKSVIKLSGGKTLTFMSLPGHSFDMLGVIVTDKKNEKFLFAGDAFFGSLHMMRYWIPYIYDIKKFKETVEILDKTNMNWYIPSHGQPVTRISETVELNLIALLSTEYCITAALKKHGKLSCESLLKIVADMNNISLKMAQYSLILCTIKSYLAYMQETGKIDFCIEENNLLWYLTQNEENNA